MAAVCQFLFLDLTRICTRLKPVLELPQSFRFHSHSRIIMIRTCYIQELKWLTRFNTRIGLNPLFWIDRCKKFECRYCPPESVYLRLLRHFINFQNDKHFVYISFVQVWLRSDQNETSSRFDTQVIQCDNIWLGKPLPVSSCIHAVIWFDFQLNNLGREKHRAELFKRS